MMARYGYTDALNIKVDDLAFEATMEAECEKSRLDKRGEPRRSRYEGVAVNFSRFTALPVPYGTSYFLHVVIITSV